MKTTIENKAEPVAPLTYPCLLKRSNGTTVFADTPQTGIIIVGAEGDLRVGFSWRDESGARFEDVGWRPITTPITITFDPTK